VILRVGGHWKWKWISMKVFKSWSQKNLTAPKKKPQITQHAILFLRFIWSHIIPLICIRLATEQQQQKNQGRNYNLKTFLILFQNKITPLSLLLSLCFTVNIKQNKKKEEVNNNKKNH
jgi:hypothetical protein